MAKTAPIRCENPPKTPARDRTFDGPVPGTLNNIDAPSLPVIGTVCQRR